MSIRTCLTRRLISFQHVLCVCKTMMYTVNCYNKLQFCGCGDAYKRLFIARILEREQPCTWQQTGHQNRTTMYLSTELIMQCL